MRTCGDEGEACLGPGISYLVAGVPLYLLGLAAIARVAADGISVAPLRRGIVAALIVGGLAGLYVLTFAWAAHT